MIKIENVDIHGIARAVYSARNAMNSWDKSDSDFEKDILGDADLELAKKLVKAGTDHSKFMRMITVTFDITAPMYWLKEAATYKVGTVRNSCSTMHTIHKKEFTLDDFSHEHLFTEKETEWGDICPIITLECTISALNNFRKKFLETKDKKYWWQMIQLLPSSYNQRSTVQLNYAVLRNIYHARKDHKLDEWKIFCKWIEESLPYSELITMEEQKGLEEIAKSGGN